MYKPLTYQEILDSKYPNKDAIINRGKKWTKEDISHSFESPKNQQMLWVHNRVGVCGSPLM